MSTFSVGMLSFYAMNLKVQKYTAVTNCVVKHIVCVYIYNTAVVFFSEVCSSINTTYG